MCITLYPLSALVGYYLYQAAESIREARIAHSELMTYIRHMWTKYETQCHGQQEHSADTPIQHDDVIPATVEATCSSTPCGEAKGEANIEASETNSDANIEASETNIDANIEDNIEASEAQYAVVDIPRDTNTWGWFWAKQD